MAVALSRISYWLMRSDPNKKKSRRCPKSSPKSSPSPDFPSESVNFNFATQPSSSRRIRKNRKEKKGVDKEYDLVIVPSDGGCLSGSESDGSDWSIGWLEPHAREFYNSDAESEDSFAVLVPCYGLNLERNNDDNSAGFGFRVRDPIRDGFSERRDFIAQLVSSLPSELL